MKIVKYRLAGNAIQRIAMPAGARILSIQLQEGCPFLWAMVSMDALSMVRDIYCFGTGSDISPALADLKHIATVQDGPFVWHFFDGGEAAA